MNRNIFQSSDRLRGKIFKHLYENGNISHSKRIIYTDTQEVAIILFQIHSTFLILTLNI